MYLTSKNIGKAMIRLIISQMEVKVTDNSAGKYLTHGLYKNGRATITDMIKIPIRI